MKHLYAYPELAHRQGVWETMDIPKMPRRDKGGSNTVEWPTMGIDGDQKNAQGTAGSKSQYFALGMAENFFLG